MISAIDLRAMTKTRQQIIDEELNLLEVQLQRAALAGKTKLELLESETFNFLEHAFEELKKQGFSLSRIEKHGRLISLSIYW